MKEMNQLQLFDIEAVQKEPKSKKGELMQYLMTSNPDVKMNLCTRYLLPTIQIIDNLLTPKIAKEFGFVNAYLEVVANMPNAVEPIKINDSLILVFHFPAKLLQKFELFIITAKSRVKNYVTTFKIDEFVYGMVFKVIPRWKKIIDLFKKGRYSAFGYFYALEFIPYTNLPPYTFEQYKVITRNTYYARILARKLDIDYSLLKDVDLADIPCASDYTFYYDKFPSKYKSIIESTRNRKQRKDVDTNLLK
jgi:hypothetical protein